MKRSDAETRPSEARDRLLGTASRIFYAEGIHSVGVDRIIAEAQVTRATFYRHYPGKEDLVLAYLRASHEMERAAVEAAVASGQPPVEILRAIAGGIAQYIQSPGFRGCAFLNAVAEYSDPANPVHQAVTDHRQWFLDTITTLMSGATPTARHFVMLRDGAMVSGCLSDPAPVSETFLQAVESLLQTHPTPQPT
ncbi:TetR/AcrR family transcriptional regulator [Actinoplanes awajinensis]|uniref:TetR family transcriptional regulator n=1 Tax=Actinoplanes awajinensis subsp. mycoplanecinus TaxID=135947 RepID=A0A101JG72_9ACTN|nr:TetR/AcrR family transcriptional regulator [Actinoplanes awajinensis]KUL26281.1 TetR family transcriptional regulator [Actinoplanes awajinensis subsp. mycoplanecinus]